MKRILHGEVRRAVTIARVALDSTERTMTFRPLVSEDLLGLCFITELQVSPDGGWVTFVLARMDADEDAIRSSLWLVPSDASATARALVAGDGYRVRHPRWSGDGQRIAFLSPRNSTSRTDLYIVNLEGAEPTRSVTLPRGIIEFAWAPDGTFAITGPGSAAQHDQGGSEHDTPPAHSMLHVQGLKYRADGVGLLDPDRPQVWIARATEPPRVIADRAQGCSQPGWTTDGRVSFLSEADDHTRIVDVYTVDTDGSNLRRETAGDRWIDGYAFGPQLLTHGNSPNGVWQGNDHHVYLNGADISSPLGRSTAQRIHNDWLQNSPVPPQWSADGHAYFQVSDRGCVHLYRVSSSSAPQLILGGERGIQNFALAGSRIAFTATSPEEPFVLRAANLDGTHERLIFDPNPWLKERALGTVRHITASVPPPPEESAEAPIEVEGWALLPPGHAEGTPRPTILFIHGGPNAGHGWNFSPIFQVLAGAGYAVIYCNPPGSQSYGESFARAVTGRWGEADFPALMAFVDAAVAAGVADPARLGITGRSYGGFSTLWVITHSERFRAAVAAEPISHLESFYGSSDIGWDWGSLQFGTDPWNGPETYRRLSPTTYAERVTTPLRLIACLSDNRTPHEQAEQMFVRLRKLGRTVDMVLIAGESHAVVVVGRPWSRVHHMRATLEFFLRHLPT